MYRHKIRAYQIILVTNRRETVVYRDVCVQILLYVYAPESGSIPLAQDYARVSRDANYLPIIIKRAKRDRAKRSGCVGLDLQTYNIICTQTSH